MIIYHIFGVIFVAGDESVSDEFHHGHGSATPVMEILRFNKALDTLSSQT